LEGGSAGDIEGLGGIYLEKTQHLTDQHLEFIKVWDKHITVEENNSRKNTKNLWTTPVEIRERMGTCIRGLVIKQSNLIEGRYSYEYLLSVKIETCSFLDSSFSENDPCIISLDSKDHPVAVGFIKVITKNTILVYLDRQLDSITFKIDQDQYSSGVSVLRGNLLSLFNTNSDGRFRKLLVDLDPPRFNHTDDQQTEQLSGLNEDQKQAILKTISSRDYSLILGMPGTGYFTLTR
jgi:DNA replication ATP-dependent helicase Dna2